MFNLILFGPPGSGKGTQSAKLIQTYGLLHISTGDLLRDEVSQETLLGLEAKKYMDEGRLVSDAIVIGMIGSKLDAHPEAKGYIFDGFPRTEAQAIALDQLLDEKNTEIRVLLSLEVPEEELKRRLLHRGTVSGRSDDNEEIIEKRIQEYKHKTEAVAAYYSGKHKLRRIKGDGGIEATFDLLKKEITEFISPV
jgi:adenylate kinase